MPIEYDYCAGVLPYTNFNNNVYFLLGKSRRNGRLVTFSGKNSDFDNSQIDTAAREFFEETLGSIMDRATMLNLLTRCTTMISSRTPRGQPCYTYAVEIPFRKNYVMCFSKTRAFLEAIQMRGPEYLEMCDMKWVCARSMLTKIRKQWEKAGTLSSPQEWAKIEALCRVTNCTTLQWRVHEAAAPDTDLDDDDSEIRGAPI